MLDLQGVQTFFNHIDAAWIKPEIQRREEQGRLPPGFKIFRCLIKLPQESPPVTEFNEEIAWRAKAMPAGDGEFTVGQTVYLHDLERIETVEAPEIDGKRVAFVYLYTTGKSYEIIFDFSANSPDELKAATGTDTWDFGKPIADSLQAVITELAVHSHDSVQQLLTQIGLWAAPSLLPYPLTKIAKLVREGDPDSARKLLVEYCRPAFLRSLSSKWWTQPEFQLRRNLIAPALDAHAAGQYALTIHALLPHLEGVITDWSHTKTADVPYRQDSKTEKFRELIAGGPPTTYTYQRIVASALDFILAGPVLSTFKRWLDSIDDSFPHRHAILHGKYDDAHFTEENSIKLILLVDTLCHIMSVQGNGDPPKAQGT